MDSKARNSKQAWAPRKVRSIYKALVAYFGDLGWWPADSDFEVIVGAVLTQNTAWVNVEKAIKAMKQAGLMSLEKIITCPGPVLAGVIRSSGYHRVKAERLKKTCRFLIDECGGRLRKLGRSDTITLRKKLLSVKGIGPETADSMLVYAFKKPVFVVDAYTRRVFSRHGLVREDIGYEELRAKVESVFKKDVRAFNQFHALLVETGKNFCKKKEGACDACPLRPFL